MCKNDSDLIKLVQQYQTLKAQEKIIKEQVRGIQDEILEYLLDMDVSPKQEYSCGVNKIKYNDVIRKTFDKDKLKDALGDDLSPFEKESISTRIYIK